MEKSSYAQGTPSWVDLSTPDLEGAKRFYAEVLGWDIEDLGADAGHYSMAMLRGRMVAGLMQSQQPDAPPAWTTYLAVDDVNATEAAIKDAGGQILMGAMDVMDKGRMLIAQDPAGAVFGCWQAGAHTGAQLVNEPGTFCWNEQMSRDPAAARDFYETVFGLDTDEMPMGDGYPYVLLKAGDAVVGGLMGMDDVGPEVPPSWTTYFAVSDTDAAVARVEAAGGALVHGPVDSEYGRWAVVTDPQGAAFSVLTMPT